LYNLIWTYCHTTFEYEFYTRAAFYIPAIGDKVESLILVYGKVYSQTKFCNVYFVSDFWQVCGFPLPPQHNSNNVEVVL